MRNFFAEPSQIQEDWIELDRAEVHHARDVLRLPAGAPVRVIDGRGAIYQGIFDPGTGRVRVQQTDAAKPFTCGVTLAVALLKGEQWDWFLEKSVEIGVSRIVPLITERGVVKLREREFEKKRNRWRQIAISALKQSGQAFLPHVEKPVSLETICGAEGNSPGARWILSERGGASLKAVLVPDLKHITLLVGPEGGWSKGELRAATDEGFEPVSLGSQVLRAETAPIYALSVIRYVTG
ncbi:MAG TPA: 16S rRNA (uracil(1498)-N(3))-methyltransferase [Acidobacteriota bacterium]|jgi:16S rRNA (uracil1498-N3)-methyltransferase|nr:16S rRNA (uracil(1498)-N(3))-methyltransferase [Acidobacteriota bacterium]